MYLFSVIPTDNTVKVLILYINITNLCHKLIIYMYNWTHLININFVTYMVLLYIITCVCVGIMKSTSTLNFEPPTMA